MPLDKSGSKKAVGRNIATEEAAGKPPAQAKAIALNTQRSAKKNPKKSLLRAQVLRKAADNGEA
jgi:hypothetical protein